MSEFMMSISCRGVLIENLEACMQQGVAISPTSGGVPRNVNLPTVEERATIPWKGTWVVGRCGVVSCERGSLLVLGDSNLCDQDRVGYEVGRGWAVGTV